VMTDTRKMYGKPWQQNVTLHLESRSKIIGNKQQVSTSIHKIYPYKLYKCKSIFNTLIWDSVQLHLILTFGKMGAEIKGQSKYTWIICTILKKTAMKGKGPQNRVIQGSKTSRSKITAVMNIKKKIKKKMHATYRIGCWLLKHSES